MVNVKLIIEYDGSSYGGWQKQKNTATVQGTIEDCLLRLTGKKTMLIGAGRTDGGVHAIAQTANFHTGSTIPAERFSFALNSLLPKDIRIKQSAAVNDDFNARFSAKGKKYRYTINNNPMGTAIYRNMCLQVKYKLDVNKMKTAAGYFIGYHNFHAFCSTGSEVSTFERTIYESEITGEGDFIYFTVHGNGFLYNMVRIMVGTLIQVGIGKIKPDYIKRILDSGERSMAGPTAPACGLCLMKVFYD